MPVMLERWNDDKMDALEAKVDGLDGKVKDLDRRMGKSFEKVDTELREQRQDTKAGFEAVHRTIIQTTVAVLTAFIVGFGALVGLIATQL
jgi:hypothetical protein